MNFLEGNPQNHAFYVIFLHEMPQNSYMQQNPIIPLCSKIRRVTKAHPI